MRARQLDVTSLCNVYIECVQGLCGNDVLQQPDVAMVITVRISLIKYDLYSLS